MIIFIRGLPGSGKTTVSEILAKKLDYKIICVDNFKKEMMKNSPKALFVEEVVPYSYKRTLEELRKYKNDNIVVEEIFRNKDFVKEVIIFCNTNNLSYKWFKIVRNINKIVETNQNRTRKIKNTPETLEAMGQQIDAIIIDKETIVINENPGEAVMQIIHSVASVPINT